MQKNLSVEGSPYSQLVQLIRKHGENKPIDVEIGVVVSAPPNIKIRLDSSPIELDKDDLIILEHLTRHERVVTLIHEQEAERDLGDNTAQDDRIDNGISAIVPDTYEHKNIILRFEDVLKPGDRVSVVCLDEQMKFVVLDRAVMY